MKIRTNAEVWGSSEDTVDTVEFEIDLNGLDRAVTAHEICKSYNFNLITLDTSTETQWFDKGAVVETPGGFISVNAEQEAVFVVSKLKYDQAEVASKAIPFLDIEIGLAAGLESLDLTK